jgi:hypothetical protein
VRPDPIAQPRPTATPPLPRSRIFAAAWSSLLVVLAATGWNRAGLAGWVVLGGVVMLARDRQLRARSRLAAASPELADPAGDPAEGAGDHKGGDPAKGHAPVDQDTALAGPAATDPEPEAVTSPVPSRPRRARARGRGQRGPLPDPPAMTLIRVGPGKYIRAEDPSPSCSPSAEALPQGEGDEEYRIPSDPATQAGEDGAIPAPPGEDARVSLEAAGRSPEAERDDEQAASRALDGPLIGCSASFHPHTWSLDNGGPDP